MQSVSNNPANEQLESYIFSIEVELERLSYFEALFQAIEADQAKGGHFVKALAKIGAYLAVEFAECSQLDIEQLKSEGGL